MTTYPTNIKVLDNSTSNAVMESEDISQQTLYELSIPVSTLDTNSRLRIKTLISRVVGVPLADPVIECETCQVDSEAGLQTLTVMNTLMPNTTENGVSSWGHVGENNGNHDIYQYTFNQTYTGQSFDNNPYVKLYRIRGTNYTRVAKVITLSTSDMDHEVQFMIGVADEPCYGLKATVTIASNIPNGAYIYFPNNGLQVLCDDGGADFFINTFTVKDDIIFLSKSNSYKLFSFYKSGELITSSTTLADNGYTEPLSMHAIADSMYVLTGGTPNKIHKINVSNLNLVTTWGITVNATPITTIKAIYAVSHNLIYFLYVSAGVNVVGIGYLHTSTGQSTIVDSSIQLERELLGNVSLHFKRFANSSKGYFYIGQTGRYDIIKIGPLNCV